MAYRQHAISYEEKWKVAEKKVSTVKPKLLTKVKARKQLKAELDAAKEKVEMIEALVVTIRMKALISNHLLSKVKEAPAEAEKCAAESTKEVLQEKAYITIAEGRVAEAKEQATKAERCDAKAEAMSKKIVEENLP